MKLPRKVSRNNYGGGSGKLVLRDRNLALNSETAHNYRYVFGPCEVLYHLP